jgi:hypothetical protein
MIDEVCFALVKSIIDSKKELTVIFKNNEPVLSNSAFNSFFSVSSFQEYKSNYGTFVDNFVPHPSYFNKEKVDRGELWFDAILKLDEIDRVVSMMSASYDPHAFSVDVQKSEEDYIIISFEDITQSLIKRIMIENNASIDKKSGAYDKQYFEQVMQSYEDAAAFNEKIIGAISIELIHVDGEDIKIEEENLKLFVENFKRSIRQDDMLVHWSDSKFLLIYIVDDEINIKQVVNKIQEVTNKSSISGLKYKLSSSSQDENETISKLIKRL